MGTIRRRLNQDGTISYQARIRRLGFGQQIATFKRRSDAVSWISQEENKIRQGLYLEQPEVGRHTLREAVARYIEAENPTKIRRTQLKRWCERIGDRLLASVSPSLISTTLFELKSWKTPRGQKIGPSTLNRHLDSLSCALKHAKKLGWIARNPTYDVERFSEPRGRVRFLSDDERKALLTACEASWYTPLTLIVLLALSTGMRKEELLNLTWDKVDPNQGTILLEKTKNKERRRVAVRGRALQELRKFAKVRRLDTALLFPGECPSPVRSDVVETHPPLERHFDIRKAWEGALKAAKVTNFRFHDLRHSCASYLAMNAASPIEIAEVLGHKSLEMVKRYSHLAESHVSEVVERMNRKIFGS